MHEAIVVTRRIDRKTAVPIKAEKRDDNNKKIADSPPDGRCSRREQLKGPFRPHRPQRSCPVRDPWAPAGLEYYAWFAYYAWLACCAYTHKHMSHD